MTTAIHVPVLHTFNTLITPRKSKSSASILKVTETFFAQLAV